VAIIVAWRIWSSRSRPAPQANALPQIPVTTATRGGVEETIALAGRVGPPAGTQLKLSFALPGTVRTIDVRLGEHVERGTSLAELDATSYSLAAQQATADAQAASAATQVAHVDRISVKLHADEAELARQKRLYGAGIVALRDVQAAQTALAADRADAQSARAQLAQAHAQSLSANAHAASASYDVSRTTLYAPAAGTVVGIFVQPGEMVDTMTPAVAVASTRQGLATLDVPVSDLPRVASGDPVHLRSGAQRWEGRVQGVAPAVDPATGLAILSVSGIPPGIASGTPIDATVVVGQAYGVVIPRAAVVEDPQSGARLVFVQTRDAKGTLRFVARHVAVDVENADRVRVTAGLRAGERVAAQGAIDLLVPPEGS
jgi:cobalt-zinc-cadmium efflux system membrane fusion protein